METKDLCPRHTLQDWVIRMCYIYHVSHSLCINMIYFITKPNLQYPNSHVDIFSFDAVMFSTTRRRRSSNIGTEDENDEFKEFAKWILVILERFGVDLLCSIMENVKKFCC